MGARARKAQPRTKRPHIGVDSEFSSSPLVALQRLKNANIDLQTLVTYSNSVQDFCSFVVEQLDSQHSSDDYTLDEWAAFYVLDLARQKKGVQKANNILAALLHFLPSLKGHIPELARCVTGFRQERPPIVRLPISRDMTGSLILTLLDTRTESGEEAAAIAWTQWELCGRISEVLNLHDEDVVFADRPLISFSLAPSRRGASTKNDQDVGVVSFSRGLRLLLERIRQRHARRDRRQRRRSRRRRFFMLSRKKYEQLFREAQRLLWYPILPTHCIRHGRASHEAAEGMPVPEQLELGRWRSRQSAARYRKPHLLVEAESRVFSPDVLRQGRHFFGDPVECLQTKWRAP